MVQHGDRTSEPLSELVDWFVAAFLVLGGVLAMAAGALFYSWADLGLITDFVAEGRLQSTELTDPELIDVTYGLLWWGGLGLVGTGLLLVLAGVAFVAYRTRARRRREESGVVTPDTAAIAIAGGVVSLVTSFVPLSPIIGGIVSGHLRGGAGRDGVRIGAYAGLVAALPLTLVVLIALGGFAVVASEVGLAASISVFVGVAILFSALVGVAYMIGLSALGGYIGVSLSEDEAPTAREQNRPV
ncbi:hypothetical protein GJ629_00415 [Halapricum sp. CBA1109]|nr:hypothetical protein [Halapricum sp. CBA1109]